ncbi:HNH endonuclease signature motif containing protein [Myroides sp. JBRI-B21084]|uniref:HNH endonuclease n=1 Tax=Myroides sp. JBRI-B21084 TaxID=3119977 RepID=UPI0026E1455E|nr:HNH endonuclease signature motif containing protein [Paenimyroides cloacae]WKW47284.1 HNH endonuclease signature motif containing protein [Paenimyroides cloacae]
MSNKIKKIKRPWVFERKPFERTRTHADFDYNARKWRKLRAAQLTQFPFCKHCDQLNIITIATVADHIVPVKKGGAGYELSNLQSLCKKCHDKKSAKDK